MITTELITKYELVLIIDVGIAEGKKEEIFKKVQDLIQNVGAKLINSQVWIPKHRLTFAIKKCREATYYMINFESDPSFVRKIEEQLKLNEDLLRFAVFQAE